MYLLYLQSVTYLICLNSRRVGNNTRKCLVCLHCCHEGLAMHCCDSSDILPSAPFLAKSQLLMQRFLHQQ